MKGRALILIFLFLISLQTACAESHTGEVDLQLSQSESDYGLSDVTYGVGSLSIHQFKYKGEGVAGYPKQIKYHDASISKQAAYNWVDIPQNVGGSFVLTDGGNFAGSGTILIHRVNHVDGGRVDITFDFYNNPPDFVANPSETTMDVSLYGSALSEYYSSFILDNTVSAYNTQNVEFGLYDSVHYGMFTSWAEGADSYVSYDYYGHFINEYNITLSGATASTKITRDGLGQQLSSSRLKLTNSTGSTVYLPSSYSTTNSTYNHDNGSYYYYLDVENYGDVLIYEGMGSAPPHTGDIEFNQTFYTDPEDIQVSWDVDSFDGGAYTYEIQVITSVSGNPSQDSWPADGNWNVSPFISSASGAAVFDFYSDGYDLPIWIQGELWAQDKSSGTWTKLDSTPAVIYHEAPAAFGTWSLETNKTSYSIGDTIRINYSIDDFYEGKLLLLNPSSQDMIEILFEDGTFTDYYYLDPDNDKVITGHWLLILYGRMSADLPFSELDNINPIPVTSNDVSVSFGRDEYDVNNPIFVHLTTQTSGGILNFSVAGESIHKITLGTVGSRDYLIDSGFFFDKISSYPVTLTVELTNNGSSDNDTTTLKNMFNDSAVFSQEIYKVPIRGRSGISVDYYIVSSNFTDVKILDSTGKRRVGQTNLPQNSFPITGTLNYDVNVSVWGIDTGTWQAVITYQDGTSTVFDTAEVQLVIEFDDGDDPAAVSNEMIGIFFSPQGIFLMFTVIITVMGLAVTKQPAGGAVCAVVGVGFGRFFNVLPTWMLLLTVIALVAFAGVSTAIYIKGK